MPVISQRRRSLPNAAVDYTLVKNLKKPSGAKPGKVVYYSNYTAYVTPKMSVKKL